MSTIRMCVATRLRASRDSPVGSDANSTSSSGRDDGSHFWMVSSASAPMPGNFSPSFAPALDSTATMPIRLVMVSGARDSGDGDALVQVHVLDDVQQFDALFHRPLEGFAAAD